MNDSNVMSRHSARSTAIDEEDAFEEAMKAVKEKVERIVQMSKDMAKKTAHLERQVGNTEQEVTPIKQ